MQPIKTITAKDKTLKIFIDENPENPRTWGNLTKMVFFDKWNHLGDKHNIELNESFESRQDFINKGAEIVKKQFKDVVLIKAVHLYNHSGITISTKFEYPYNDQWDSGTIGFVVVTKENIRKSFKVKNVSKKLINKAKEILEGEIETLDQYVRGDVYGFKLEDATGKEIESCWGFFGEDIKTNGIADYVDDETSEILMNS